MGEKVKIVFLGTASAVPTARRNHTSIALLYKGEIFLFDCGEGTQRQMRKAKLNFCKINKIFISHWHGDHILGLMGLLETLAMNGYNGNLSIYGPKGSKKSFSDLVAPHLSFYLDLSRKEGNKFDISVFDCDEGMVFENEEFFVESIKTRHNISSLAFSFTIKEKNRIDKDKLKKLNLPNSPIIKDLLNGKSIVYGGKKIDGKKLIYKEPQRKITYISDTKYFEEVINFSKNSDVLICESTYGFDEEEKADEFFHLTCGSAAKIAKKSKSKSLYLIHLSQKYDEIPNVVQSFARKIFKNTNVAEDLEVLIL